MHMLDACHTDATDTQGSGSRQACAHRGHRDDTARTRTDWPGGTLTLAPLQDLDARTRLKEAHAQPPIIPRTGHSRRQYHTASARGRVPNRGCFTHTACSTSPCRQCDSGARAHASWSPRLASPRSLSSVKSSGGTSASSRCSRTKGSGGPACSSNLAAVSGSRKRCT